MPYEAFKHIHMTLALLTLLSFVLRSILAFANSPLRNKKFLKITPHILDTVFLLSAITLLFKGNIYPFEHLWIMAKILGLVVYIVFGVLTMKAKSFVQRSVFFVLALATFAYVVKVALTKNALFFIWYWVRC